MNHNTKTDEPNWYYLVMGDVRGPVSDDRLREIVETNELGRDSFVRRADREWVLADRIGGLFHPVKLAHDPHDGAARADDELTERDELTETEGHSDDDAELFYQVMGEVRGPVSLATWEQLVATSNDIGRDTLVRRLGADWMTADSCGLLLS